MNSNRIIIGSAQFINKYSFSRVKKKQLISMINILKKNSKIIFDTSPLYSDAEKYLKIKKKQNYKIGSKLPSMEKISENNIKNKIFDIVKKILKKMNINKLEYFLIHNETDLLGNSKIYDILLDLKKRGLVKKIGVSIYSFKTLDKILKKYKLDIVQVPFNLLDRRLLNFYSKRKKLFNNTEIHVRSIFLKGLLLRNLFFIKNRFKHFYALFYKLHKWCEKSKINQLEACINFVSSHNFIKKFVVGFDNLDQFNEVKKIFDNKKKKYPKNIFSNNLKIINPNLWKKK